MTPNRQGNRPGADPPKDLAPILFGPGYGSVEDVSLRVHGPAGAPVLVHLPGLHGDWTLVAGFRRALAGRVQFAEVTYPLTTTWDLADYGARISFKNAAPHELPPTASGPPPR